MLDSPICTPEEIRKVAHRCWPVFIEAYARGESEQCFPMKLRVRLQSNASQCTIGDMARAVTVLREHSKEIKGTGYSVKYERRRSRHMGENDFPVAVTIDTPDDLVRLTGRQEEFRQLKVVLERVRMAFPALEGWLQSRAKRLAEYAHDVDSLIAVAQYFVLHPQPDLYLRQLPVPVDTKFIERNERILVEWLDKLLPVSAIRVDESSFARRYGLRDGTPYYLLRLLDSSLLSELQLPTDELAVPMRYLKTLKVRSCTVIIAENRMNLLTLPRVSRGLALGGMGHAVTGLRDADWLAGNRILYWGDLDVDGFRILANLRTIFPGVESFAMELATLTEFPGFVTTGNRKRMDASAALTPAENAALAKCSEHNLRLEQERIPQGYINEEIRRLQRMLPVVGDSGGS